MSEQLPEVPSSAEETREHGTGAVFVVKQAFAEAGQGHDPAPAPTETTRPQAALARSYLESAGEQAADPMTVYEFITSQLPRRPDGRLHPMRLPAALVTRNLQNRVLPADAEATLKPFKRAARAAERKQFINKAALYYPLPEIISAIRLQVQLQAIGRSEEAASVSPVLEAYGRTIETFNPHTDHRLLWAKKEAEKRNKARGL
ncbi:MAG TPA: hypothetical protein VK978_01580 [Candidatus Saccharimonadales bacterium]|nr:hypothetical protein [Candidatus Saccharimonadales bacterium]